jgi:predicted ABC-type ATPase
MDQFSLRIHIRDLVNTYVRAHESFWLESNLVSNYSYDIVADLAKKKYFTQLVYMGVDELNTLNERINERVKLGQHYVSPADVAQRYKDSLSKLPVNLKLFNEATLIDNSQTANPIEVLQLQDGIIVSKPAQSPAWLLTILPTIERLSNAYEIARNRSAPIH